MLSNRPRILVVDDHTLVTELCRKLLETEFDVVVIVDAAQQVKAAMPAGKLFFLTTNSDVGFDADGFRRGASRYLPRTHATTEMMSAVRDVLSGKSYMSPTLSKYEIDYLRRNNNKRVDEDERLTERQREVLQLLAEGKAMKEVGDILKMTTRTVAFHKYRIMESLGARSNAELIRYAVRNHLVPA